MRRECRERFPRHRLAIPICITVLAWRTCRDASRGCLFVVSFEVDDGEKVPGIPCACATKNFTYLVRGPLSWNVTHFLFLSACCEQVVFCLAYYKEPTTVKAYKKATLSCKLSGNVTNENLTDSPKLGIDAAVGGATSTNISNNTIKLAKRLIAAKKVFDLFR